ncbi:MAG TPA: hypothetical protein QF700_08070 [Prochlorococcus sp.]|nr:hypothetical protein [Prochlorococcus sp.]
MSTPAPSFEQAIEITAQWLRLWEEGELSDEVLADRVSELVASRDGARGFFVVSLAGDSPLMDRLPEALVMQLRAAGDGVVDLTVRNLAMSTAMAMHHQRTSDMTQQARSKRVTSRCTELLRLLEPKSVKTRLEQLLEAVQHNHGEDVAFLNRWGYDDEQKQAITASIEAIAET